MNKDNIIHITKLSNIFSNKDIQILKAFIKPQQCHFNAAIISILLNCKYCEAECNYNGVIFPHAFNKIGNNYIDFTLDDVNIKCNLKREYTEDEIIKIFKNENKCFITYKGALMEDGFYSYNNDGKRIKQDTYIDKNRIVIKQLYNPINHLQKYTKPKEGNIKETLDYIYKIKNIIQLDYNNNNK